MLDFICMGPVDLPGACRKRQNTKWKQFLSIVGLEPTNLRSEVWCSTDWASRACWKLSILMTLFHTCTSITNVYIVIRLRMMKQSVFCLVNELFCDTHWNIYLYCTNSKRATQILRLLSTCKHDQTFFSIWYMHVESKHMTYGPVYKSHLICVWYL